MALKKKETLLKKQTVLKTKEDEDDVYTSDDHEEEKEYLKEFPKSSTNFFSNKNQKKSNKRSIMTAKDKKSEFPQIAVKKNQDIIEKFYDPFIQTKKYNIGINKNLLKVKSDTRQSAFDSHHMIKKKNEIKNIGKELLIYQNPSKIIIYFRYKY